MRTSTTVTNQKYAKALGLIKSGMSKTRAITKVGLSAPSFYAREKKTHTAPATTVKRFKKLYTMTKPEKRTELARILKVLRSVSKQLERI